jgi:hypothetical protein
VQHRLPLLNSQPIHTSWGTAWNFRNRYTSGERPVWTSVAMVLFAALWIVVIQNLRTMRFHFPRKKFLSGFFWLVQSSGVVNLATVNCFLVFSFHLSLFVLFQFVPCLVELF